MYYFAQICRACIKNDGKLIKIHELDVDNITFYKKLSLCFPNMVIEETNLKTYLCQNCSNILRKMYDFRELYINSGRILNTYVLQLKEANSFKNSKPSNLKELIENNYKNLTTNRIIKSKSSELKLEKFYSGINKEVIKTETLDIESVDNEWLNQNSESNVMNEEICVTPDCQVILGVDCSDDQEKYLHGEEDLFKCKACHVICSSLIYLEEHTLGCGKNDRNIQDGAIITGPIFKCSFCPNAFSSSTYYEKHLRYCRNRDDNVAREKSDSNILSPNTSEISRSKCPSEHKRTDEKRYKCDVCSKGFNFPGQLKRHVRVHTGEKPYECDVCNKSFHQLGNLHMHKRIHTGEKPYECDVCGKRFNYSGHLRRHRRIHTGEKPYECDVCRESFNQSGHLHLHKRIHSDEKLYECDVCRKSFNQLVSLSIHKQIHISDKV